MIPGRENDHASGAPSLLTDQFRGRPVVEGVLKASTRPFGALESAAWDVIEKRALGTAANAQLDVLGAIVGEPRRGRADAQYTLIIRMVIRARRSQGRSIDVLDVLILSGLAFTYEEVFPAGFRAEIFATPNGPDVAYWVFIAKALGVRGDVVFTPWSAATTFALEHVGSLGTPAANVLNSVYALSPLGFPIASVKVS